MKFGVRAVDSSKTNSLTKYPSIATYHKLGPNNGGLLEEPLVFEETSRHCVNHGLIIEFGYAVVSLMTGPDVYRPVNPWRYEDEVCV